MCNTGKSAALVNFALDLIGMQSYLYDESMCGWNESPPLSQTEKNQIKKYGLKN